MNRVIKLSIWIFLLAWLSQVVYLVPVQDVTKLASSNVIEVTKARGWILTLVLISFGILAGAIALKYRLGLFLMLISSLTYVGTWWLFSGYFDVRMSPYKLFGDLWSAAQISGREMIFLHRDVVLNAFYHLMVFFLCYVSFQRRTGIVTT